MIVPTRLPAAWWGAFLLASLWLAELPAFEPPQRHLQSRYEQDWARNPFTLKTAPVVAETQSFAKDLALGGIDNLGEGHRVILVNVKTQQRFPLKEGAPNAEGLVIKQVHRATTLKDSYVEIARGTEVARLEYNEAYLKSVAASTAPSSTGAKERKTAGTAAAAPPAAHVTAVATAPSAAPAGSLNRPPTQTLASQDVASASPTPASVVGRSESPTVRQRRRVQTVPNTP